MVEQLHLRLARIGSKRFLFSDQKNISCVSYLLGSKKSQEKSRLPN